MLTKRLKDGTTIHTALVEDVLAALPRIRKKHPKVFRHLISHAHAGKQLSAADMQKLHICGFVTNGQVPRYIQAVVKHSWDPKTRSFVSPYGE